MNISLRDMTTVAPPPPNVIAISAAMSAPILNVGELPVVSSMDNAFASILLAAQQLEEAALPMPEHAAEQIFSEQAPVAAEDNLSLLKIEDSAPPVFDAIKAAQYLADAGELTLQQLSKMVDLEVIPTSLISEVASSMESEHLPEDEVEIEQEKDFDETESALEAVTMLPAHKVVHEVQYNLAERDNAELPPTKEENFKINADAIEKFQLNIEKSSSSITKAAQPIAMQKVDDITEKKLSTEGMVDNVAVVNLSNESTPSLATTAAHLSAPPANAQPRLARVNANAMERLDNLKHSVSEQVAIHINKLDAANSLSAGKGIKIQLYPQELGEIIVKMQLDKQGNAAFEITSNKASSLQLLQLSQLDNVIQKHVTVDGQCSLEFGLHQEQLGQQHQQQQQQNHSQERQLKNSELERQSMLPEAGYYAVLNSAAVNIMV